MGGRFPKMGDRATRDAKPTDADKAAAARLKSIYNSKKKALDLTEETLGARWPYKEDGDSDRVGVTQGTINQYLNGRMALNFRAVLFFANELQIQPQDIRDDLVEIQYFAKFCWPFESFSKARFEAVTEKQRGMIEMAALTQLEKIEATQAPAKPDPATPAQPDRSRRLLQRR